MPGSIFEWARFGKCVKVSDRIFRWKKKKIVRMDRSLNRLVIIFFYEWRNDRYEPFRLEKSMNDFENSMDRTNEWYIYICVYIVWPASFIIDKVLSIMKRQLSKISLNIVNANDDTPGTVSRSAIWKLFATVRGWFVAWSCRRTSQTDESYFHDK